MMPSASNNDDLTLQAYCDGELDAAATSAFEQRLAADADLRQRRDQVMALRARLRGLSEDAPPADLATRIKIAAGARPQRQQRWPWRAMAACLLIGVLAGSTPMWLIGRDQVSDQTASVIIGNHIRGALAPQSFDVASSDRHTVKPWFAARVAESPKVPDLAQAGFTLVGGRIDVIGQTPVPTIIYKHAAHVVSVTALPQREAITADTTIAGYHLRSWRDGDFVYVAVSDIPETDLAAFEHAFIAEARQL
ncbi:MAG: anti-sigma factor [Rhizobiales bacterium]|nr:anti-sigma factor [Hyphomicrobiales bacterium]